MSLRIGLLLVCLAMPISASAQETPAGSLKLLYVWTAVTQALDVHSSVVAFKSGAREANPLLAGFVSNRLLFIGTKAGVTTGLLLTANRAARHHRKATIVTLIGINCAYAFVATHNYRLATRGPRPRA